jgi:AcrR family transcriptional regulator
MLGAPTGSWQTRRRSAARAAILAAAWAVAREHGLAALTLREVAARVGMRAPSLYTHFPSKNAIYDAMFGQAWEDYEAVVDAMEPGLPATPRAALTRLARTFFDFATADLARHQLMNQRIVPDFTPSDESYAPAVRVFQRLRAAMEARTGTLTEEDVDLYVALVGGLCDAQWANDPGGDRYARILDRAVDMYADALALPKEF